MEKIRSLLCLFLTAVVLLSACQKNDSSPQEETFSSQKEEEQQKEEITLEPVEAFDSNPYTNAMMLEDYDFFWTTLEENCAALGALQEVAGVDLEQIKTEGREQVTALADGDATGFSSVISTIAQKMGGFAHIRPMEPDAYYRLMDGNMWESDTQQVIFSEDGVSGLFISGNQVFRLIRKRWKRADKPTRSAEKKKPLAGQSLKISICTARAIRRWL